MARLDKEYKKMAEHIEDAQIYDGRGTYDLYECDHCSYKVVTTYKDKGVTPFCMPCPCCGGTMSHTETMSSVDPGTEVLQWVRPTLEQFKKLGQGAKDHVLNGGLLLETDLENE